GGLARRCVGLQQGEGRHRDRAPPRVVTPARGSGDGGERRRGARGARRQPSTQDDVLHPDRHVGVLDALRRTAFLLERAQESSYRIAAFRGAAAAVAAVPAEELRDRAASGRLRELPGVGERTATLITEVLAGQQPGY